MNTPNMSNRTQPRKNKFLSPWFAYPLALLVWEGLPWAISLLTPRYGWIEGRPGVLNLPGLILVAVGTVGLLWGVSAHSAQSPPGIEWKLDKSYLLTHGMYAFSRHPMYLSELILLFGWVIFYGSFSLFVVFLAWFIIFNYYAMPKEERILEAHFGESYREYKNHVFRWFGRTRH